jgi:hypothetical protein
VGLSDFPRFIQKNYELHEWRHASAVLRTDFQEEWDDIVAVLTKFRICKSHIIVGGGGKSKVSASIDRAFTSRGWQERKFQTQICVDENIIDSPTHKVDWFKNGVGVEIEWNNKTEFYDRDLNNFRLLFELRALNVGVIITRCDELQEKARGGAVVSMKDDWKTIFSPEKEMNQRLLLSHWTKVP